MLRLHDVRQCRCDPTSQPLSFSVFSAFSVFSGPWSPSGTEADCRRPCHESAAAGRCCPRRRKIRSKIHVQVQVRRTS